MDWAYWLPIAIAAVGVAFQGLQEWRIWQARTPAQKRKPWRASPVSIAMVILLFGGAAAAIFARQTASPAAPMANWGPTPEGGYTATLNSAPLVDKKASHRIMLLAFTVFPDKDAMTDQTIQRSGVYTITGGPVVMATTPGKLRYAEGIQTHVNIATVLIPANVRPELVTSLSEIERLGGHIVAGGSVGFVAPPATPK